MGASGKLPKDLGEEATRHTCFQAQTGGAGSACRPKSGSSSMMCMRPARRHCCTSYLACLYRHEHLEDHGRPLNISQYHKHLAGHQ